MGGPGYQYNGGILSAIASLSDQVEAFILADKDDFSNAVAAPVNTDRWTGEEYIVGAGSSDTADINATAAGKAYIEVDPAAALTGYWLRHKISRKSRFYTVTADMTATWGTPAATDTIAGIAVTKGAAYDANNHLYIGRRKNSTPTNNVVISGALNGVAVPAQTVAITADTIAFKIERWNNIWVFYYSTVAHPDYIWNYAGLVQDASNFMTTETSIALFARSPSPVTNTIIATFDNFAFYISSESIFQAIANNYVSTHVTSNADGNVFERLEWIQTVLGGEAIQGRQQASGSIVAEQGSIQGFNMSLWDMDGGPITAANIDITGIVQTMERSRDGGAFSAVGITQPVFAKVDGSVYVAYQFLDAEWKAGDQYRLTLTTLACTIGADTWYPAGMVWSNAVQNIEMQLHESGTSFRGIVTTAAAAPTLGFKSVDIHNLGDNIFNDEYYAQIISTTDGAAPLGEIQKITDYVSATGEVTVGGAYTGNVDVGDQFIIIHESLVAIGRNDANNIFASNTVVANDDGSMLERLERIKQRQVGTPASGVIDNLNVNTEQDLVPEATVTTVTRIDGIFVDYTAWYADANITGTGATLTVRVYLDDSGGTLRLVENLSDVVTEGLSGTGMIKVAEFGTVERNYKVTVQSSVAPAGGAASNLVKYHYSSYDKE